MNVKDFHTTINATSTVPVFKPVEGNVISIQIPANEQLKEHITKVPAFLICLAGEAIFENEKGVKLKLATGDYVNIEPQIKHWINAKSTCNLVLIK